MKLAPLLEQHNQKQLQRIADILNQQYAGKWFSLYHIVRFYPHLESLDTITMEYRWKPEKYEGDEDTELIELVNLIEMMFNVFIEFSFRGIGK